MKVAPFTAYVEGNNDKMFTRRPRRFETLEEALLACNNELRWSEQVLVIKLFSDDGRSWIGTTETKEMRRTQH